MDTQASTRFQVERAEIEGLLERKLVKKRLPTLSLDDLVEEIERVRIWHDRVWRIFMAETSNDRFWRFWRAIDDGAPIRRRLSRRHMSLLHYLGELDSELYGRHDRIVGLKRLFFHPEISVSAIYYAEAAELFPDEAEPFLVERLATAPNDDYRVFGKAHIKKLIQEIREARASGLSPTLETQDDEAGFAPAIGGITGV